MSLKLVPISPFVSVTETGTSAALKLQSALIQKIVADGSGSVLTVIGKNGSNGIEKYSVTQTPAQVAALTQIHIELSEYSTSTWSSMYVNAMCFRDQIIDESTHRVVFLDFGGGARSFRVTQSLATLLAALNTSLPAEPTPVVTGVIATVAGAGTGTISTTAPEAIIPIGNTADGFIVILPAAVSGTILHLVATSAFTTVIDGNGAETVDGGASITLGTTGAALTLMCHTTGAWVTQTTQVGQARSLKTNTILPIVATDVITIGSTDAGVSIQDGGTGTVKLQTNTGDAVLESTGGNVRIETTTGNIQIDGNGAAPLLINNTGNTVEVDSLSMLVPDGGVYFQTGTNMGISGDGVGDEMSLKFNTGVPLKLYRTGGNATHGVVQEGFLNFGRAVNITGAADPGYPVVMVLNEVITNAATHGVLLDTSSDFCIITAGAGIAADVQVRSALGVVVDTIAAGVTKQFINFGGVTGWKSFTL